MDKKDWLVDSIENILNKYYKLYHLDISKEIAKAIRKAIKKRLS